MQGGMFGNDWRVHFYFWTQIVGGSGLTVLLLTMLWPTTTKRNPVLISLCFSWWMSSFPCLLLLYYAGQVVGTPPSYSICLASASLTLAQSPLTAISASSLVFHIWFTLRDAIATKSQLGYRNSLETICLVLMPYLGFSITALTTLVLGLYHPASVQRTLFYCVVDIPALEVAVSAVCLATLVLAAIFGVWTGILLIRNCSSLLEQGVDQSFTIRVFVFAIYVLLGLCLNGLAMKDWTSPVPDLFLSTFSIIVFLIFGSQRDITVTWAHALTQFTTWLSTSCHSLTRKLSSQEHPTPHVDVTVDIETTTQTSHGGSFATLVPYPYSLRSGAVPAVSKLTMAQQSMRQLRISIIPLNATPPLPSPVSAATSTLRSGYRL